MLRLVETRRVYSPETIGVMTAAFERVCQFIPKSLDGDKPRRQLALIILRHVDRGVHDPEPLFEAALREFTGPQRLNVGGASKPFELDVLTANRM